MDVTDVRACRSASLPTCSCLRAASSRTRFRFLLERSSMAAARALPASGAGAAVATREVGALLGVVVVGLEGAADVLAGLVTGGVGACVMAPAPCVQAARAQTATPDRTSRPRPPAPCRAARTLVSVTVSSLVLVMVQLTGRSSLSAGVRAVPAPLARTVTPGHRGACPFWRFPWGLPNRQCNDTPQVNLGGVRATPGSQG